jgi:hypothetical protein
MEASYGAKASAQVELTRADSHSPWTVSRISMSRT